MKPMTVSLGKKSYFGSFHTFYLPITLRHQRHVLILALKGTSSAGDAKGGGPRASGRIQHVKVHCMAHIHPFVREIGEASGPDGERRHFTDGQRPLKKCKNRRKITEYEGLQVCLHTIARSYGTSAASFARGEMRQRGPSKPHKC